MLSKESIDYLLADFHSSIGQWQHMNDRMDKELQYYATLIGSTIAISGLILQLGREFVLKLLTIHALALIACVAGLRLLRRIVHLTGQSALFSAQIGLIRSYFIDNESDISSYIILTTATQDKSSHDFTPISRQLSIRILCIVNSGLAAIVFFLIPIYFYNYSDLFMIQSLNWLTVFAVAAIVAITLGILLFVFQRRISIYQGDRFLDSITQAVQSKRQEILAKQNMDN